MREAKEIISLLKKSHSMWRDENLNETLPDITPEFYFVDAVISDNGEVLDVVTRKARTKPRKMNYKYKTTLCFDPKWTVPLTHMRIIVERILDAKYERRRAWEYEVSKVLPDGVRERDLQYKTKNRGTP